MTRPELARIELRTASDVASVRQSMRLVSSRLGFDQFDQVQIATGTSELGRLLVANGGGELVLSLAEGRPRRLLVELAVADADGFAGRTAGSDELVAARRLIGGPPDAAAPGAAASFSRLLPPGVPPEAFEEVRKLVEQTPRARQDEIEAQNQELVRVLELLRARDAELAALNAELEETNRGVLALYNELDDRAETVRLASEERSRFLSNVTHELRTPLSSILALCRLLTDGRRLAAEQMRQIRYIQKSAQDLYDFVSDLLDLAKFEAGKTQVHPADFEVRDLFSALRGMFRPLATDPSVTLTFDPGSCPTLHTDEGKVSQILRNLISNALKFTERGSVRVTACHDEASGSAVFTVADSGAGIAREDLERIFDEFTQVGARDSKRERGTGLGLPLSRTLAAVLGGELTAESSPGAGSTFRLTIPVVYAARGDEPAAAAIRALVVDDDAISRYVVKEQLERAGWAVVEAGDAETALGLLREGAADVAILDLLMPGKSGFEVLEQLRVDGRLAGLPVAVRTSVPVGDIDAGAVEGVVGVFSKDDNSLQPLLRALRARLDDAPASRPHARGGRAHRSGPS